VSYPYANENTQDNPEEAKSQVRGALSLVLRCSFQARRALSVINANHHPLFDLYGTAYATRAVLNRALDTLGFQQDTATAVAAFGAIAEEVDHRVQIRGWANVQPAIVSLRNTNLPAFVSWMNANASEFIVTSFETNGDRRFTTPIANAALVAEVTTLLENIRDQFINVNAPQT
jgi:hypothetical protein